MSSDMRRIVERRMPQEFCPAREILSIRSYNERILRSAGYRWLIGAAVIARQISISGLAERGRVSERARERALEAAELLHPAPGAVTAAAFVERPEFFSAFDKVQVKYEMLRAHLVDGETVTSAAATHGYSRASFYLVARSFEEAGMVGLLDERPGRRGPVKLSGEVLAFLEARRHERPGASGAELAQALERALGVRLHRRTIERVVGRRR